jgi:hypothetical protein
MGKEATAVHCGNLKEFCTMSHGWKGSHVHMDHRNLTHNTLNSQRILQWCLFLEECHPAFHSVKGANDAVAETSFWGRQANQSTTGPDQPHLPCKASETLANKEESNAPSACLIHVVDNQDML